MPPPRSPSITRQWEAYRAGEPLPTVAGHRRWDDARRRSADRRAGARGSGRRDCIRVDSAPNTTRPEGELRIVAGEGGAGAGTGTGGDSTAEGGEVEGKLVASEEERDRIARENDELVYKSIA